mgnify:CR=1 FL=1
MTGMERRTKMMLGDTEYAYRWARDVEGLDFSVVTNSGGGAHWAEDLRIDFLGINAIHGDATPADAPEPWEVAVRVAARTRTREEANKVGREVDGMAVSGVAHTGKRVPHADRVREVIGVWSTLVPREAVRPVVSYITS